MMRRGLQKIALGVLALALFVALAGAARLRQASKAPLVTEKVIVRPLPKLEALSHKVARPDFQGKCYEVEVIIKRDIPNSLQDVVGFRSHDCYNTTFFYSETGHAISEGNFTWQPQAKGRTKLIYRLALETEEQQMFKIRRLILRSRCEFNRRMAWNAPTLSEKFKLEYIFPVTT